MRTQIRQAVDKDATALALCIKAAYERYKDTISDLPDVSSGLANDIKNNVVFVAERDATLVGGVVLEFKNNTCLLANLAVHPDFGGQGIAGMLVKRVVEESADLGCSGIVLNTHIKMPENVAFYEHLGWSVASTIGNKIRIERLI